MLHSRRFFLKNALLGASFLVLQGALFRSPAFAQDGVFEITRTDDEWKKILTPQQFRVLRKEQTETSGSSPLNLEKREGTYFCAGCDLPLFSSKTKYESGTGWPSFWEPLSNAVSTKKDYKLILPRTEVHCRRCGGHLGHVFNDGPPPTGKRYCMNGTAMNFRTQ